MPKPRARFLFAVALLLALLAPAASVAGTPRIGLRPGEVPSEPAAVALLHSPAAAYDPPLPIPTRRPRQSYTVQSGDTLGAIAHQFDVTTDQLIEANGLANPDSLKIGQRLSIPGSGPATGSPEPSPTAERRGSPFERLPPLAQSAAPGSPLHKTIWVSYYGRPEVPILGILGEYNLDDLMPILRRQARAYDEANGPELGVTPALHLIYGMAMTNPGDDNSHLAYLHDEDVRKYIDRAAWEGMGVILDVQIGNLTPLEAIKPAFQYLKYDNVHLALDPEFAMTGPGQTIPGQPAGTVTAEQINQVQAAIVDYMQQAGLADNKMLIVHQFLPWMIEGKEDIAQRPEVDVVICADGFGGPWPKVSKYNAFMDETVQFAGFKLFYRWDEPIMNERQVLGIDPYPGIDYMQKTPSLVVYQ